MRSKHRKTVARTVCPMSERDLTWPALLARWTAFAQSSLALPKTPDGDRWRSAVPAIINLQAVTFALPEVQDLPESDRPLALDKAEIIIRSATGQLHALWPTASGGLPTALVVMVHDAGLVLASVRDETPRRGAGRAGWEWR